MILFFQVGLGIPEGGIGPGQSAEGGIVNCLGWDFSVIKGDGTGGTGIVDEDHLEVVVMGCPDCCFHTHVGLHATDHQLLDVVLF